MKIIILTAEKHNFVPVELQKAAVALGIEAFIVDITKIVVDEMLHTVNGSGFYLLDGEGDDLILNPLKIDTETVVIPRLNEYHLSTKVNILKKMENYGAWLLNSSEGMELCNDKLMTQLILNHAGLETPRSWVIQDASHFDLIVGQLDERKLIKFPIIVKTFRGTHGIGVMKLDSKSSLVSVGQTLLKEGIDFMLQEFIGHEQSCRIIMKGNELLAANLRGQPKGKGEFRTNSHLGSETQPYEPSEQELEMARKVVELFGTSFCAIDYIVVDGVTRGEELPTTEGLIDGHIHVLGENEYVRYNKQRDSWIAVREALSEDVQEVINSQLAEGRRIIVLEVNGSPGLEAMQKNWPERNLAAEVISFAVEASQQLVKPEPIKATQVAVDPSLPAFEPAIEEPVEEPDQLKLIEPIIIHRVIDEPIDAKVDTGARTSSLHVDELEVYGEMVRFKRGDIVYRVPISDKRRVKAHDGASSIERPFVRLDCTIHGVRLNGIEFSLTDRGHMKYQVLIGRNIIEQLGLPISLELARNERPPHEDNVAIDSEEE